jgi:hypothetical protein
MNNKKTKDMTIAEELIDENDLILSPASISKFSRGFIPQSRVRTDHEVQMAKSDLYQAAKNAVKIFTMIKDTSEQEGIEGWVQEKIIKAADYLNTVREYLEGQQIQEEDESVGPVGQLVKSGVKPEDAAYAVQVDNILRRPKESMDGVAPSTKMFTSENKKPKMNSCNKCGKKWKFTHECAEHESIEEDAKHPGLWANIRAKQERIKGGSGEHMRKPGSKGAPTNKQLKDIRKSSNECVCTECGGPSYDDPIIAEEKDACYHKVRSRYKVWPSAYASGALVKCRKVGAKNWGNKTKK